MWQLSAFKSPFMGTIWLPDEEGYPSHKALIVSTYCDIGIHVVFDAYDKRLEKYKGVTVALECWGKVVEYFKDNSPSSAIVECARVIEVVGMGEVYCPPIKEKDEYFTANELRLYHTPEIKNIQSHSRLKDLSTTEVFYSFLHKSP
jgi:hypothetical protein